MSCEKNDDPLLFLLHGQLDVVGKTRLIGHLFTCAACRARYRDFHRASALFMDASAPFGGVARRNRIDATLQPMLAMRGLIPALFVTMVLGVLLMSWSLMQVRASTTSTTPTTGLQSHGHCRPDLPNDHCR